jgi:GAF domain-containing protein/DNA-binding response OmpR family regulator/anti-sigma regulatory factor (Ser/Thr protein kinase)
VRAKTPPAKPSLSAPTTSLMAATDEVRSMAKSTTPQPNWFKRFITPPAYADEDLARSARLLHAIVLVMWMILILAVASTPLIGSMSFPSALVIGGVATLQIAVTYLNRHGRVRPASIIFTIFQWSSAAAAVALLGGLGNPTSSFVLLPVVIGGLLLGLPGILLAGGLTILSTILILIAEQAGALPPTPIPPTPIQYAVDTILSVLMLGGLLYLATSSIQTALSAARHNATALGYSNRELQEIRTSLEMRIDERTNQLNVSAEVARTISAILDPQEIIAKVVELIVDRFQYYYAAVFLVDDDGEFAVLTEATGAAGQALKQRGHKLEISGSSMVAAAIATRRARLAQDVDRETMRFANPLLTETKSEISLPLIVGADVIGALDVQATRTAAFDESTVLVLQGLADQIAIAINNARQYQAAQQETRHATALLDASRIASRIQADLPAAAQEMLNAIAQAAHFDSWQASLYDAKQDALQLIGSFDVLTGQSRGADESWVKLANRADQLTTEVIRTGKFVQIDDPANDPRLLGLSPLLRQQTAILVLPAIYGEQVVGIVSLERAQGKHRITRREIDLIQAAASQLAIAIENRRLLQQTQAALDEAHRLMHLYQHEGWATYSQSRDTDKLKQEFIRPGLPPLRPEVLSQIDAALSRVSGQDEIEPVTVDGQSIVNVPIELRGEVFGTLTIQDEADRRWTDDELATLQAVAAQVAQSLEAARLLEESETSLQDTMALYRTSRAINAAQTLEDIIQAVATAIQSQQVNRATLLLLDPAVEDDPTVEVAAIWKRDDPMPDGVGARWRFSQVPIAGRQMTEPDIFNDIATDPTLDPTSRQVFLDEVGVKARAAIPMLVGSRPLGWLVFESTIGPYIFTEAEIRRYRTLAGQVAVSLENRRLFQDVQARVGELTILTRIGRRLASTLQLDEILNSVVEETLNATKAAQASIALYNEGENALEVRVMHGFNPQIEAELLGTLFHPGEGLHGRLLETGEVVLVNNVAQAPDYREVLGTTRSELLVPIKQGGLLLGALNLESTHVDAFTESDVRLIEAMADQVAVAITNARAYEAERQAVERMREVDRLKTQFLANMSHELRTPLNSIIGFSRVMLRGIDGPLTEMQNTDLTSIYNSGQHLLGLINNILDLSKIEAGKMELSIEPVNLVEVAKTVMSTAIALVKDKQIKLEQDVPADLPTVMADQTRVRQIILNLVSNAAKFTDKGYIRLSMVPAAKEVMISVTDTGIGIPEDKLAHIFEEFTQVDASTTRKYGGTGLGLAITRSFVEMHKGRIWVESKVGAGSTFTFTLPREQPEPEPIVTLPTDLEARGAGKRLVMCIDDDPGVLTLYKRYLEKQNYQVIGVTDPSKAVEEAKRLLPYAITLDVMMPHKDGWDVLADLKKTPEVSNIPILICSIIQNRSRGFALGAADYLVKPITEDELLQALNRVKRDQIIHKVLIVDDEPSALQLLRRILGSQPGYQLLEAGGGAQALSLVEAELPELIILDLMMPEVDGFTVLEAIKSNPATHNIPVIIVTAKEVTQEDRERLNGHMEALFNKGIFSADQLLNNISAALDNMNREIAQEGKQVEVFHKTS